MAIKRRDLLDASRLLTKHRLTKPGELDQAALMLGVQYLGAKRDGETDLEFLAWLDEDVQGDELDDLEDVDVDVIAGEVVGPEDPTTGSTKPPPKRTRSQG